MMNISNAKWLEQLDHDIEYWHYMERAAEKEREQAAANIKSLSDERLKLITRMQSIQPTAAQLAKAINESMGGDVVQVVVDDNGEERVIAKGYYNE